MSLFDSVRFSVSRRAAVAGRQQRRREDNECRLGRARWIGNFRGLWVTNYNNILPLMCIWHTDGIPYPHSTVCGGVIFMEGVVGDDYIPTLVTFLPRPLPPPPLAPLALALLKIASSGRIYPPAHFRHASAMRQKMSSSRSAAVEIIPHRCVAGQVQIHDGRWIWATKLVVRLCRVR
jgi:hypothetical protein